jgi:hypothetical protein
MSWMHGMVVPRVPGLSRMLCECCRGYILLKKRLVYSIMDNVTKLKVDNKLGPTRMSGVTFFGSFPPNKLFGLKSMIQQSLVCRTSLLVRLLVGLTSKQNQGILHKSMKNQQAIRAACRMATPPEEKKTFLSYPFG